MITTAEFKKQIAKSFGQAMRKYGFKGSGLDFYTETNNYIIAVFISPGRWGGNCTAGFAVHPKEINKDHNGLIDLSKLKIHQFEFKMNLSDYASGERWEYSDNESVNLKTVTEIMDTIRKKAFPVIEQFQVTPNILEQFNIDEMEDFHTNWTKRSGVSISTTGIRFAWAMTLIFEEKWPDKAKQFAQWGLRQLSNYGAPWFGVTDFKRVMNNRVG